MAYCPLHCHDTFGSCGDSILRISDLTAKAKELGCPAVAITNHGSLATFVSFYEECKNKDINPIVGCEFYYVADRTVKGEETRAHLILLAKNYEGLRNLIRIHNDASEHFYKKPRTDISVINRYREGLICLTACVSGPIGTALKEKDYHKVLKEAMTLKEVFGDDLYLEIQPGHFKGQILYNDLLVNLSKELSLKLVATNDIHYLNRGDAMAHNWHIKDNRKDVNNFNVMVYPDSCYYLMTEAELYKAFFRTSLVTDDVVAETIANTNEIGNKCNLVMPEEHHMPQFDPNIDEQFSLAVMCYDRLIGMKEKLGADYERYEKRLEFELDTIEKLSFAGYFLIVKDIIDNVDKMGIARGPGRGSCCGSIISFLLGISVADPIRYGLLFERFLSVNRKAIPDVDLDLSHDHKQDVIDYVYNKYGKNRCCAIATYQMRKARSSIRTAARILGIPNGDAIRISNAVPEAAYDEMGGRQTNISLSEAYEMDANFRRIIGNYPPELLKVAKALEGYPSSISKHASGIVISPVDIYDRYPLVRPKNEKQGESSPMLSTSLDLKDVEKLSGVKFDLLSLGTLDAIKDTMDETGVTFDFTDEELLSDPEVWKLIGSEFNAGLFQISSKTYRTRMPELHPTNIEELAACLALVRGPCISNGTDKVYMDIVNGRRKPEEIHPVYWNAVKETYGVLVYQEQILNICTGIGFDSETAYDLLKAITKKKIEKIKSYEAEFFKHGREKAIAEDIICRIWHKVLDAGLYCFNKSHAVSYALVCYESAYLKRYYTINYMASLLTKQTEQSNNKPEALSNLISECKALGFKFLPPDVNMSRWNFTVEAPDTIRIGYCAVKGLGKAAYGVIENALAGGEFKSFADFLKRAAGRTVNRKSILIMIAAGMFSGLVPDLSNEELAYYYVTDLRNEEWAGDVVVSGNISVNISATYREICQIIFGTSLYFY